MDNGLSEDQISLLPASETRFRRAVRSQNRFVSFLALIAVPGALAIWLSVADVEGVGFWPFWVVVGFLVAVQAALYLVTTSYSETLPQLHLDKAELEEIQETMAEALAIDDAGIQWLSAAHALGMHWSNVQGLMSQINPVDEAKFQDACRLIVVPMIEAAGVLFDFEYGEVWSAAVYRYDESLNLLVPAWWQRPDEHPSEVPPRSWQPGDGHVGSAFMQSRILFTTDATSEETSPLLQPSAENQRDYDADIYRSFVSAPILLDLKPDPMRFGVLVITSNEIGRFDGENQTVVAHAAQVLAHLFHWRHLAPKTGTS